RKLSIAAATIVGNGKNSTLPVCPVPKGTPFFCLFTADMNKQIDFTTIVNRALIITGWHETEISNHSTYE
ncbi:hypothetical protein, partial [Kandleria vitulina]|uniref:hypothetical protein n=1 Tax=Kandleria vitulina TaxID=1630 RepID=UPI0005669088